MKNTQNKKKRFYEKGETIWAVELKKEVRVKSIDKSKLEIIVTELKDGEIIEHTFPLWSVDVLKYKAKEQLVKSKKQAIKYEKFTYFASVNGGTIPTKEKENAGRDCYARLEPIIRDGKEVFELRIPQLTMAKIPLGFASYLNIEDLLSLKHERSSIGSTGMIIVSGLIDSTYIGEVILQVVPLISDVVISSEVTDKFFDETTNTYFIPYHKAIAQAVVFPQSEAIDVHIPYDNLLKKPSTRGTQGWGSSGK
jgi:dUTPase